MPGTANVLLYPHYRGLRQFHLTNYPNWIGGKLNYSARFAPTRSRQPNGPDRSYNQGY